MSEDAKGFSADFAASFKALLDHVASSTAPAPGPFVPRLREHLGAEPLGLPVVGDHFDVPDHPNLQRAIDAYLSDPARTHEILGVAVGPYGRCSLTDLLGEREESGPRPGAVEYASVPLEDGALPCVQNGLYLIRGPEGPLVALVRGPSETSFHPNVRIEVMARRREEAESTLADLRRRMREGSVYRGRVLSLFLDEHRAVRVGFHRLGSPERSEIILPEGILERVERQTKTFAAHADRLRALGRHMKRGLLLYGPPGTGKTLLTRYVVGAMPGRTAILLTGRGLGLIQASCAMARMLQPATVVLEDVDLVAEERTRHDMGCNVLLFELLNEMDGLEEDADIAFILTTNRPDILEPALASRPGRIDQAIEIPVPDANCRRRLFELYGRGMPLGIEAIDSFVRRTEGVSAAFIRELLRRAALLAADEGADVTVSDRHVDEALHELVVRGGALTRNLLGAGSVAAS
jgi:hypothetical protein